MISSTILKYLINKKIKDAECLSQNKRYPASIYIAGYALEIALKAKVCKTLNFNNGFPENKTELNTYLQQINKNNTQPLLINISQIRNHNLAQLLFYSGAEPRIKSLFLNEWSIVNNWNPEDRYTKKRILKNKSDEFIKAMKSLVKEIT